MKIQYEVLRRQHLSKISQAKYLDSSRSMFARPFLLDDITCLFVQSESQNTGPTSNFLKIQIESASALFTS